jgi:hypothetical protein
MTTPPEAARWRKSSASDGQDSCVELAHTRTAVRDSKNPTGPALTVELTTLVTAVKAGRFDR